MSNPAQLLEGIKLNDDWKVIKKNNQGPKSTGGHFSVGYIVEHKLGKQAFLKALDFSSAFESEDPSRTLQGLTSAYNFERDILYKCINHKMNRIVTPLADGKVNVNGSFGPLNTVCYLIFEKAEGNIRQHAELLDKFDLAWCLRSMHHTAIGIKQLHSAGIAHQDIKPSNVLVFPDDGSKISDLGRATDIAEPFFNDKFRIPGDQGYAPPEQFYGFTLSDAFEGRKASDMYLFGSLFYFFFADVSATQSIELKLQRPAGINQSMTDFESDLPYIQTAFYESLIDLRSDILPRAGSLTDDILLVVKELCNPDPRLRGDKAFFNTMVSQYSLERYISRLNELATKIELNFIN